MHLNETPPAHSALDAACEAAGPECALVVDPVRGLVVGTLPWVPIPGEERRTVAWRRGGVQA